MKTRSFEAKAREIIAILKSTANQLEALGQRHAAAQSAAKAELKKAA